MPTVRRPELTQSIGAMPNVRKTAAATFASEGGEAELARGRAEAAKAGAEATRQQAKANFFGEVTRVGADLFAKVREQERQAANQTALIAADNQLAEWQNKYLYDPQSGALNRKGKDAMPLPEETKDAFNEVADQVEAGLTNDDQRMAFARLRSQTWQGLDLQVRRHTFTEMNEYRNGELKNFISNTVNKAQHVADDPKMVQVELEKGVSAIRTMGPSLGMGQEAIDAQVRAVQSQVHENVIGQLLADGKDKAAQAYFDAASGQIDGEKLDAVKRALEEGTLRGESQRKADDIIRQGGSLTEQLEKAKDLDPKVRDQVEQRLEHNAAIEAHAKQVREEDTLRGAYNLVDKSKSIDAIPPQVWTSLDGSQRSALRSYAHALAKGEPITTDDPTFYALMTQAGEDPTTFLKQNLLNYRAKLSDSDFQQLAGLQLSLRNGDRKAAEKDLAGFRTKKEIVDDTLTQYGINPNAKPTSKEGVATANLRRLLDQRVDALQADGKKVTNEEIQGALDTILGTQVKEKGSFFNLFVPGKPFLDRTRRAVDTTIDDIPADKRQRIEERLRSRGEQITDQKVLDWYIDALVQSGGK